jgi:hypothetical protein
MQMTKKITSIVLAVLMVVSMMSVMAISASAAGEIAEIVTAGEGATGQAGDQFTSVRDAVNAAGEGGEVKLIADIYSTGNEGYVGIDGDYTTTLDLNGHNITANGTSGITLYSKYPGGKTFTIKGSGTVSCTPKYVGDACISDSSGRKVVIKGGTYTNTVEGKNALYVSSDQGWTIEKGTFNGNIKVISDLTVKGGTINGDINATGPSWKEDPASVTITGGTVNGELVSQNGSTFEVTGGTFAGDVTQYVDTTVYKVKYTATNGKVSYKTNLSSVGKSGTYQLLGDLTANSRIVPLVLASNVVFDLNGYTLTSTATDKAFLFSRAGSASKHNSYTIKNGKVVAAGDGVQLLANYADLTLENVDIVANGLYGVVTNGTNTGNNITATDSSITAGTLGIYKPSNGSLTLTDTDVTGKTAVYVKSGNVSIDGGTFTGTGAAADYSYNDNGANITGDAIVIDNCGYPGGAPSIAISSGTFTSDNANAVGSYGYGGNDALTEFISGGNFSNEVPDKQCAKGFEPAPKNPSTGLYTVEVMENPLDELLENAADISDDNKFGLDNNYNVGAILGAQRKDREAVGAAKTSDKGAQELADGDDIRFVAVLSTDMIKRADDYGFVLAKVGTDKTTANTVFDNLKAHWGNGEKTISAKDTYNNICGDERYGNPKDISTDYKYITCAVNGLDDSFKVVARFYVVIDGKTYYAKYAKGNYAGNFRGITAGLSDLTN